MIRSMYLSGIAIFSVLILGCQSEADRQAAERQREKEAEEMVEELFGGLAEALEEAIEEAEEDNSDFGISSLDSGDLSPIEEVLREAEGLNSAALREYRFGSGNVDYDKFATASDMVLGLIADYDKTELTPYSGDINGVLYNGACAYSLDGDVEKALTTLQLAFDYGWDDVEHTMQDSDLENLRATAEFKEFASEMAEVAERKAAENIPAEVNFPFDFSLTSIEGKPLKLADYKDKVVIVDFWGTWCPPCRAEIPSFIKLQNEFGEQGFQMIGLNYEGGSPDADTAKVQKYVSSEGINYPCALGDDSTQEQVPNFNAYPTTLFIDKTGQVRHRLVGLHSYADLAAIVKKLLNE